VGCDDGGTDAHTEDGGGLLQGRQLPGRRLWDAELMAFGIGSFWAVIASGSTYPVAEQTPT